MKRFIVGLSLVLGSVAGAMTFRHALDLGKVNTNITAALADVVTAYTGTVTDVAVAMNPATDIDKGNYVVDMSGQIVKAPWNGEPAKFSGRLGVQAVAGEKAGLEVAFAKTVTTNGVALFQYMAKMMSNCSALDAVSAGVERVLADKQCETLKKILAAKSVMDIRAAIEACVSDSKMALQGYLAALAVDQPTIQGGSLQAIVQQQIALANKKMEHLNSIQFGDLEGGFSMTFGPHEMNGVLLKDFKVELTEGGLKLSGTATCEKGLLLFDAVKPEINNILTGLEQAQPTALEIIKMKTRVWLNVMAKMLAVAPTATPTP